MTEAARRWSGQSRDVQHFVDWKIGRPKVYKHENGPEKTGKGAWQTESGEGLLYQQLVLPTWLRVARVRGPATGTSRKVVDTGVDEARTMKEV